MFPGFRFYKTVLECSSSVDYTCLLITQVLYSGIYPECDVDGQPLPKSMAMKAGQQIHGGHSL